MESCDVFVSFSCDDDGLGKAVHRLVNVGLGVKTPRIFKFDVPASGGKLGDDRVLRIRQALQSAKFVVMVISQSFLRSDWCRFEFGGAWVLNKPRAGLLVPPVLPADCPEIIGRDDLLVLRPAMGQDCLNALVASVEEALKAERPAEWDVEADRFVGKLAGLIAGESACDGKARLSSHSSSTVHATPGSGEIMATAVVEEAGHDLRRALQQTDLADVPQRQDRTARAASVGHTKVSADDPYALYGDPLRAVEASALGLLGAPQNENSHDPELLRIFGREAGLVPAEISQLLEENTRAVASVLVWRAKRRGKRDKQYPFPRGEGVIGLCHAVIYQNAGAAGLSSTMDVVHRPKGYTHSSYAEAFHAFWEAEAIALAL